MGIRVVELTAKNRAAYQERVAALESLATYPIGDDFFQIDHGPDYYAFFDRLGKLSYFVALDGEQVIAVAAGIVRRIPVRQGGPRRRAWYGCDLKVHPDWRRRHVPMRMLRHAFCPHYARCPRGYGVSMNPKGRPNPMVKLAGHWRWTPIRHAETLALFSLDADAMRAARPLVEEHRGPASWLSLAGVKDIILQSTGEPMPLLHLQTQDAPPPGPRAAAGAHADPVDDHVHMLCAPERDPLTVALRAAGHAPSATATVIAHGLKRCDWRFIHTSDI